MSTKEERRQTAFTATVLRELAQSVDACRILTLRDVTTSLCRRHPEIDVRAVGVVQQQSRTSRGAIILGFWPERGGHFAAFYIMEFEKHGFSSIDFCGSTSTCPLVEAFCSLCRKYSVGFDKDTV